MAIEVFNRYEYKYILSKQKAEQIQYVFQDVLNLDEFCQKNNNYKIINRYIDTKCYQMIRTSLEKPIYKEKLRIRMYGNLNSDQDFVYFEIKKKYKGLVNKRRCKMKYCEALTLINTGDVEFVEEYMNKQILNEIKHIIKRDQYVLTSLIEYDRIAYFTDDRKVRISFDYNVHSEEHTHFNNDEVLMEIKTPDSIPLWLVRVLNELNIKSSSFSKYGIDFSEKVKRGDIKQNFLNERTN